jgi:cyclopropane-fatty-acyl-phospholipid synthase
MSAASGAFSGRMGLPEGPHPGSLLGLPEAAREVLGWFAQIDEGALQVELPDGGRYLCGERTPGTGLRATLQVRDWTMFEDALARGDIGFGESYIDGAWDTPDLATLLTLLNRNRAALARGIHGRWWRLLVARLRHRRNANTRAGSRRNIMAHYDLGNAFYAEWLDPGMNYSSALFADGAATLEQAQLAKCRRVLAELGVRPGDRLLEIGCGWGGFAEVAAREAGASVTGITLSPAQHAYARARLQRAGLADRVRIELADYRSLPDPARPYDHVVSIEMFEAVGERWWNAYFAAVRRQLKPSGGALLQTITIDEALFAGYRRRTDFIQQHVFPGGMLASAGEFTRRAARAGLELRARHAFGGDYARTLALWRERFNARGEPLETLGFDARFRRLWNFYLAYCEAGFAAATTDVVQFHLARR